MPKFKLSTLLSPKIFGKATIHVVKRKFRMAKSKAHANRSSLHRVDKKFDTSTLDQLLTQLGDKFGVIELIRSLNSLALGVADVNFLTSIHLFCSSSEFSHLKIDGGVVPLDSQDFNDRALSAYSVKIYFKGIDRDIFTISVEAYFKQESGYWLSNNSENKQLRALRDDRLEEAGFSTTTEILGGLTLERENEHRKIDAVYTWVDHSDENWANSYIASLNNGASVTDADSMSRFHNNSELKYSLRSLWENAPWINKIYILSNCQKPDWMKETHPKIVWVDHAEVLPHDTLPTFSSHAIESSLHRLPGISDCFIYLNDDVFICRPKSKSFFFDYAGNGKSFLEKYGMVSGPVKYGDPDYLNAARNSSSMLRRKFGFISTQLHHHTVFALRRDILSEIETTWKEEFNDLVLRKFRTAQDFNLTSFLYHHYALKTGRSHESTISCELIKSSDVHWRLKLETFDPDKYDTLCLNEGGRDRPPRNWHSVVSAFLEVLFPYSAPWEQ